MIIIFFIEFAKKRRRGRGSIPAWANHYTTDYSIILNFKESLKKHKISSNHTLKHDRRALDFFLKMKNKYNQTFNCPLINYTLLCVHPYKDEVLTQDEPYIDWHKFNNLSMQI